MITSTDIREDFVKYFRQNEHKFLAPSKVYNDDPSLFFVNSGMCQLKDVFLGKKEFDQKYSKLVNWQICIRAGGKHNDLDDVGYDTYHLTSFTMLGNWSLNAYGKDEAIRLALEYLIINCKLDRDRLYATYFEGNDKIGADIESYNIWKKYLPENQIVKGSFKDNFWMMANEGPCGPSTEIHYDLIGGRNASEFVNKDDPTVIEIWNNVFMEYNAVNTANELNFVDLDKKFVDTGMGLERLAMVLNNKKSVYEIDIFKKIFAYAYILGSIEEEYSPVLTVNNDINIAYRIFADHIRTCVIAIFDGVEFDCNKRGHILRKIFRRALIHFYIHLNNYNIQPITKNHLMPALITEILNYYLFKNHNSNDLKNILEKEELLYIGKINKMKLQYNQLVKRGLSSTEAIDKISSKNNVETSGIGNNVIDNLDKFVL